MSTPPSPSNPPPAVLPHSTEAIARLQAEFAAYQQAAFGPRESAFFALELCGEAGELANLEKKAWRGSPPRDRPLDEAVADEAADVFISILNYANSRGIDLATQVAAKLATIERRRLAGQMGPHKHA